MKRKNELIVFINKFIFGMNNRSTLYWCKIFWNLCVTCATLKWHDKNTAPMHINCQVGSSSTNMTLMKTWISVNLKFIVEQVWLSGLTNEERSLLANEVRKTLPGVTPLRITTFFNIITCMYATCNTLFCLLILSKLVRLFFNLWYNLVNSVTQDVIGYWFALVSMGIEVWFFCYASWNNDFMLVK